MIWKVLNLVIATTVFVGNHFWLSAQPLRSRLCDRFGDRGFLAVYSIVALVSFVWMCVSYVHRAYVPLWTAPAALEYLPLVLMPFALYLIIGGYLVRNPMTLGQTSTFDAERPVQSVVKITRHPAMWGIALWALSHLAVNGDLGSLILFGGLSILAVGGAHHIDHRRRRTHPARFAKFSALTSFIPFVAILAGRARFQVTDIQWLPLGLALAVYIALLILHEPLLGVRPWPH